MIAPTQANRAARVKTVLADDMLVLLAMDGIEAISRVFEFRLTLLSASADIKARMLLGTAISVSIDADSGTRELNGIVSRFTFAEPGFGEEENDLFRYEAIVSPRLWLLTRTAHCRFFHGRTVLEILDEVISAHEIDYEKDGCVAAYPALEHCTQYNESDFDFLSRLLERDGIYYAFDHRDGKDWLVLADAPSASRHAGAIGYARTLFDGKPLGEGIYRWQYGEQLTAEVAELTAFDFKNAKASGEQQALVVRAVADVQAPRYRMTGYETHYDTQEDGGRLARARIDALHVAGSYARGAATALALKPGRVFTLTGHPRADQNGDYHVIEARYRIRAGDYLPQACAARRNEPVFDCTFRALPARVPYRPPRITRRPQAGLQTAIVVADAGDAMATERFGRVKLQFHWEQLDPPRGGERMRRCWVRVAQGWAGRNWGMVFMPRAGQEVVVAFIDGDPDRPLVVGCLYNSANPPPYALPSHQSISAIRSESLAGDGEHNELRFNDQDLQLLLYAGGRADSYVKRSALAWVGEDAHSIVRGKQLVKVGGSDLTIEGAQRIKVGASASLSAGVDVLHEAGANYSVKGEVVHVKGGAAVVIEAGATMTLKCGGSFITITPAGVQVSGPIVGLNSGGAAGSAPERSPDTPATPTKADDGSAAR